MMMMMMMEVCVYACVLATNDVVVCIASFSCGVVD